MTPDSAAEGFNPEHIAQSSASFWVVHGLTLELDKACRSEDKPCCPMTHARITNVGMTADGFVYQLGYIETWLADQNRGR